MEGSRRRSGRDPPPPPWSMASSATAPPPLAMAGVAVTVVVGVVDRGAAAVAFAVLGERSRRRCSMARHHATAGSGGHGCRRPRHGQIWGSGRGAWMGTGSGGAGKVMWRPWSGREGTPRRRQGGAPSGTWRWRMAGSGVGRWGFVERGRVREGETSRGGTV